ncbi:hypothetical protein CLOSYM_02037 [[Clostridium] symbiosum ATCC 14940]|uniref:Uncharacterized protein n=1 Tax=[Clostridium] symbiosum ATCC 14940 TaxID=411472 RepID=A0ABC9TYR2_CLOSY|nr:hypothetical protein CLOSYM_02037 [[Clostridium] symbiosum ATCC 14940]
MIKTCLCFLSYYNNAAGIYQPGNWKNYEPVKCFLTLPWYNTTIDAIGTQSGMSAIPNGPVML